MFNGVGQSAVRDSAVLLAAIGGRRLDESKTVPLLDISSFEVTQVTIRHILNYVFTRMENDGLSDSDDDVADPDDVIQSPTEPATKRRRTNTAAAGGLLSTNQRQESGAVQLQHDIDERLSLRRGGNVIENSALCHLRPSEVATADKNQFRPSRAQSTMHNALINDTYTNMSPQQFVEHVQIHWKYGFFPHLLYCVVFLDGISVREDCRYYTSLV
ncbi:hypothetical protein GQ600_118 [Phytophthora cactorum]|nr:hypothetical protein GQ600_118 [Phytophthora cactorum]